MGAIAGIFSLSHEKRQQINLMTDALIHRGTSALTVCDEGYISMSCRSNNVNVSQHTLISFCGRYRLVFDGVVYNCNKLSEKLEKDFPDLFKNKGAEPLSDTQIILELFAAYGPESVKMLNGVFAYSVYDRKEKKLFLFRDRLGVKPLFYSKFGNDFWFASELRSLMKALPSKTFNLAKLPLYLHLGYFPEPYTVINEAKKLPAGHYGVWDGTDISFTKYWTAEDFVGENINVSFNDAVSQFMSVLENAVEDSLLSDIPLGVFLSGGIDSSLVAAIAASKARGKIKTFTVSSPDAKHDESVYAGKVAKYLNSEHYEMPADEKALFDLAVPLLKQMDEPLADSSFFPVYIVSSFARQHVTAALGGDGGDELFQGYGAYKWASRLSNIGIKTLSPFARLLLSGKRHQQFFHPRVKKYFKSNIFCIEQNLFTSWELESEKFFLPKEFPDNNMAYSILSPQESQAFFDINYSLKDDFLVKVDRASMLANLEVIPPLLDHRVVETALRLPFKFKIKNGETKILLKEILAQYIPRDYFERPKKGFSVPMQRWLKSDLTFLQDEFLKNSVVRLFDIVPQYFVDDVVDKYMSGKADWFYNRVWTLIVLSQYLEQNKDIEIIKT